MELEFKRQEVWCFNQAYTVVYWVGGSEAGTWKESTTFPKQSQAFERQRELNEMGYAAYVYDRHQLLTEGMPKKPPEKWDFVNLCWKA
jgi:hypothetical protein